MATPGITHLTHLRTTNQPASFTPIRTPQNNGLQRLTNSDSAQGLNLNHLAAGPDRRVPQFNADTLKTALANPTPGAKLIKASAQYVQHADERVVLPFQFTLDPGRQVDILKEVYASDPLLRAATHPEAMSELFYRPSSTEVTQRLLGHYQKEHQLIQGLEKLGIKAQDVESNILFQSDGRPMEHLVYDKRIAEHLDAINQHLTPAGHQKLLQSVFGPGITLSSDLNQLATRKLTAALVAVARNSDGLFDALKRVSSTGKVEFGVLPASDKTNDFATSKSPKDPGTLRVQLNQRTIDAAERDLPKMAATVQVALLMKDDLPPDLALKLTGGRMVSEDQPRTMGLLPPVPRLRVDEPILQLHEKAVDLLKLAETIDIVYHGENPGYEKRIGDLYREFTLRAPRLADSWVNAWDEYVRPQAQDKAPAPEQHQTPDHEPVWKGTPGGTQI